MIRKLFNQNKAFYIDVIYSILASGVITITTTLIINPYIAKQFDASSYGLVLSLAALVTAVSAILGNTLNTVRLIENAKDDPNQHRLNYKVIILFSSIISMLIVALFNMILYNASSITMILLMIFALTATLKNYYVVVFRIKINTKKNLIMSILVSISYMTAFFVPWIHLLWPIIYILGEVISLIFIKIYTEIPSEHLKLDYRFKFIMKAYFLIILSSIIANVVLYLDRFLIYPILGPDYVTIYSISTIYSKMFSIILAPISSLILSYISQSAFKMTKKLYNIILYATLLASIAFILTVPIFAPWLTKMLYPQFYNLSSTYLMIGAIGVMIGNISLILNPIVLRFVKTRWQLYISLIYGTIYITLSIILMNLYGLSGFYVSVIISNTVRGIILIILSRHSLKTNVDTTLSTV